MNPYKEVAQALRATNSGKLVAGIRWLGDCGCVFGTLHPEGAGFYAQIMTLTTNLEACDISFQKWAATLGLTPQIVKEIETFNDEWGVELDPDDVDYYGPVNNPDMLQKRWRAVLEWLDQRAAAFAAENP